MLFGARIGRTWDDVVSGLAGNGEHGGANDDLPAIRPALAAASGHSALGRTWGSAVASSMTSESGSTVATTPYSWMTVSRGGPAGSA